MLQISKLTRLICGITLITVPSIEFGGTFLLKMLRTREAGYLDNPLRQNLFRAGHAHAGVIVILSLICQLLVDSIVLPDALAWFVRIGVPATAIVMPLGFFLSVTSPRAERPNGAIGLVYVGAVVLAASVLILGVGLVRAAL
jgi:hypothetical protein